MPDEASITINGISASGAGLAVSDYRHLYGTLWQNMQRENDLINYRISWALLITAAFITAQAFIAGGILDSSTDNLQATLRQAAEELVAQLKSTTTQASGNAAQVRGEVLQKTANDLYIMQSAACFLMVLMSLTATYVSLCAREAVHAAINQLEYLKEYYLHTQVDDRNLFETLLRLPRPFGDPTAHRSGVSVSRAFCPILLTIWITLAIIELICCGLFAVKAITTG